MYVHIFEYIGLYDVFIFQFANDYENSLSKFKFKFKILKF